VAQFRFEPQEEGDLALDPNDLIEVLEAGDDGWWQGRNIHKGCIGKFPCNYCVPVEKHRAKEDAELEDSSRGSPRPGPNGLQGSRSTSAVMTSSRRTAPPHGSNAGERLDSRPRHGEEKACLDQHGASVPECTTSQNKERADLGLVVAQFRFDPQADGDLALDREDIVEVLSTESDGWWYGRNWRTKESGTFPANYCISVDKLRGGDGVALQERLRQNSRPGFGGLQGSKSEATTMTSTSWDTAPVQAVVPGTFTGTGSSRDNSEWTKSLAQPSAADDTAAATKIQALRRGMLARRANSARDMAGPKRHVLSDEEAAVKIQALHRGKLLRRANSARGFKPKYKHKAAVGPREELAAVRIQAARRGMLARRAHSSRSMLNRTDSLRRFVEPLKREAAGMAAAEEAAAIKIQAVRRGILSRRSRSARAMQVGRPSPVAAPGRANSMSSTARLDEPDRARAAAKIQALYRKREARLLFETKRKEHLAACKIQGRLRRRRSESERNAVVKLQARVRGHLLRRGGSDSWLRRADRERAAVKIQLLYRAPALVAEPRSARA